MLTQMLPNCFGRFTSGVARDKYPIRKIFFACCASAMTATGKQYHCNQA